MSASGARRTCAENRAAQKAGSLDVPILVVAGDGCQSRRVNGAQPAFACLPLGLDVVQVCGAQNQIIGAQSRDGVQLVR